MRILNRIRVYTTLVSFSVKTGFILGHLQNLSTKILIHESTAKYTYRENFRLYGIPYYGVDYCCEVTRSKYLRNYLGLQKSGPLLEPPVLTISKLL